MDPFCLKCEKPEHLCVCSLIQPRKNRVQVLVLQHPQEPDKLLGTAKLTHLALENSKLRIGLSTANLRKATGDETAEPSKWGVLYLGSGLKSAAGDKTKAPRAGLTVVKKNGEPLPDAEQSKVLESLTGIIVLDGTWSQAKALWWRNPWLLKLRRLILQPSEPSLYRELRKEPRRECLSTIESVAECLKFLGEEPEIPVHLREIFSELLKKARAPGRSRSKTSTLPT